MRLAVHERDEAICTVIAFIRETATTVQIATFAVQYLCVGNFHSRDGDATLAVVAIYVGNCNCMDAMPRVSTVKKCLPAFTPYNT